MTGLIHDESGRPSGKGEVADALLRRLARKVEKAAPLIEEHFEESLEDAEVVVISFGSSAMSGLSAVRRARREGMKAGLSGSRRCGPSPTPRRARRAEAGRSSCPR